MKEHEIAAKFCNACGGSSRPQTFFEETELENISAETDIPLIGEVLVEEQKYYIVDLQNICQRSWIGIGRRYQENTTSSV